MRKILKYPGSKWNIVSQLVKLIPEHHSYVEPYFGSGAMLFSKAPSDIETVNDLDDDVYFLFQCIKEDAQKLSRMVMTTPYSRQMYDDSFKVDLIRDMLLSGDKYHKACQFLVKCWQSHGFRANKDKVGWRSDVQGRERSYALWDWYRLPEWIIDIAERLRKVQIENRPALEVIERFNYPNVFLYLDPPYVLGTRTGKQYKHEMTDADHVEMLELIIHSKAKIMISGYESDMYNNYLSGWEKRNFQSCAEYGKPRIETIWMNFEPDGRQLTILDLGVEYGS